MKCPHCNAEVVNVHFDADLFNQEFDGIYCKACNAYLTGEDFAEIDADRLHQIVVDAYNRRNGFMPTEFDGEFFTIVESWRDYEEFITEVLLYTDLYKYYGQAILQDDRHQFFTPYEFAHPVQLLPYGDLRLGRNGHLPLNDEPYFTVPEPVQAVEEIINEVMGEWGFSDEYTTCSNCGKAIRTSPDSYSWQPDYIITRDGEILHLECIEGDYLLDEYKNSLKPLPEGVDYEQFGLTVLDTVYENGLHPGMNDDPKIALRLFKKAKIDIWFKIENSQFYTEFQIVVRDEDADRAKKLISGKSLDQGWDNAEEMGKALRGEPSDHMHVETKLISPEDFINGNL